MSPKLASNLKLLGFFAVSIVAALVMTVVQAEKDSATTNILRVIILIVGILFFAYVALKIILFWADATKKHKMVEAFEREPKST